jgi:lipopolysaccharide/colanic/teichoic acid biosynthesis glycosyltransferase
LLARHQSCISADWLKDRLEEKIDAIVMSLENLHPMRGLTPSTVSPLNPTPYEGAALAQDELSSPVSRDFQTDRLGPYSPRFLVKRAVDIVGALVGLTLLTPVMMAIALLVRLDSPGPAFFGQLRRGHRGRLFRVFKFRTMIADAEQRLPELENSNESRGGVLFKLREDPRVTPLGRFLRRHSLDELPQLINVLWGEMSLVGPRPLQLRDSDRLLASNPADYFRRLQVVPGLTGPWQVGGRSEVDYERMLELDLHYVDNWSLGQDLWIICKTFLVVLLRRGAY